MQEAEEPFASMPCGKLGPFDIGIWDFVLHYQNYQDMSLFSCVSRTCNTVVKALSEIFKLNIGEPCTFWRALETAENAKLFIFKDILFIRFGALQEFWNQNRGMSKAFRKMKLYRDRSDKYREGELKIFDIIQGVFKELAEQWRFEKKCDRKQLQAAVSIIR